MVSKLVAKLNLDAVLDKNSAVGEYTDLELFLFESFMSYISGNNRKGDKMEQARNIYAESMVAMSSTLLQKMDSVSMSNSLQSAIKEIYKAIDTDMFKEI